MGGFRPGVGAVRLRVYGHIHHFPPGTPDATIPHTSFKHKTIPHPTSHIYFEKKNKPYRVVDAKVEGEAADEGDGGGGDDGEALEVEGRDGVERAGRDAARIHAEDEGAA